MRRERSGGGGNGLGREHVPVARRAERAGQPLELGAQRLQRGGGEVVAAEGEAGAQAPRADAHLVHPLGVVVVEEARRVGRDLVEALDGEGRQRWRDRHPGVQRHVAGAHRLPPAVGLAVRERMAALGLVRGADGQRQAFRERAGELEQPCRMAGLELDLDLGDGCAHDRGAALSRRPARGADFADVDAELGARAVGERELQRPPLEVGREAGAEPAARDRPLEALLPRRRREQARVEPRAGKRPLVLAARVQRAAGAGQRRSLHRLPPVLAVAAHAQRDAGPRQAAVGRVVVRADEARLPRSAARDRDDGRVARHRGGGGGDRGGIDRQLEFDLGRQGGRARAVAAVTRPRKSARGACARRRRARAAPRPWLPSRCTRR